MAGSFIIEADAEGCEVVGQDSPSFLNARLDVLGSASETSPRSGTDKMTYQGLMALMYFPRPTGASTTLKYSCARLTLAQGGSTAIVKHERGPRDGLSTPDNGYYLVEAGKQCVIFMPATTAGTDAVKTKQEILTIQSGGPVLVKWITVE